MQDNNKLSTAFLKWGCEYYAIASYSIIQMHIGATMFHHAIEILIKAYLVKTYSLSDLKNPKKFGHNLIKLWSAYKSETGNESLSRFDTTINDLNKVEDFRYPEENFILHFKRGVPEPLDSNDVPQYFVNVSDLDDIALSIFESCNVNPKAQFNNSPVELREALPPKFKSW